MKPNNVFGKLHKLQQSHASNLALIVSPRLPKMPLALQKFDDPFLPFGKAIIDATRDLVCAYVFDLPAYLALGAAGAVALERTAAYVGSSLVKVLHGPFVGSAYVGAAQAFNVDAVTVANEQDEAGYRAAGLGAFLVGGDLLTLVGEDLTVRLLGEDILYAGQREDFAERVRAALLAAGS